jgi:TonB family protein
VSARHLAQDPGRTLTEPAENCSSNDKFVNAFVPPLSIIAILVHAVHGSPTPVPLPNSHSNQGPIIEWNESLKPQMIRAPYPDYPYEARRNKAEGKGFFDLHVRQDGTVSRVEIFRSTGHQILDKEAVRVLMAWKFPPNRKWPRVRVPITFIMSSKRPSMRPDHWPH